MSDQPLDRCGCCRRAASPTPQEITNRPGLPAIEYRLGTFASFKEAMIRAAARDPRLRQWTARSDDEHGMALIQMWAYIADILTFYQERIANEAYLGTARLRESVVRLAALLDYTPSPGVAASTNLVFSLEDSTTVEIPVGLQVQSVPGQDQEPQKFETVEAVKAHATLNRRPIVPVPVVHEPFAAASTGGTLLSRLDAVSAGDTLVVFDATSSELKEVDDLTAAVPKPTLGWTPAMQSAKLQHFATRAAVVSRQMYLFGNNAPNSYLVPTTNSKGEIVWTDKALKVDLYCGGCDTYLLDSGYQELKAGSTLLLVQTRSSRFASAGFARMARVRAVSSKPAQLGPLQDTVTQVEFKMAVTGTPAMLADHTGYLHAFAIGDDQAVWHLAQHAHDCWDPWKSLGGRAVAVAAGRNSDNGLEVFAVGSDGALWHRWQTKASGSWSQWASRGAPRQGVPLRRIAVGQGRSSGGLWSRR